MFGLIDGGGPVLTKPKIVLMYWGAGWANNPAISSDEITGVFSRILATPYMSRLFQYRGIGNARIIATDQDTTKTFTGIVNNTPAFSTKELTDFIASRIDHKKVPDPTSDSDILYMVMSELSVVDSDAGLIAVGAGGFHSTFDHNGNNVRYSWLSNPGNFTLGSNIAKIFVHELVEACSDPDGNGFRRDSPGGNEIGDVCNSDFRTISRITTPSAPGGVVVQSYWSHRDQACVMPDAYSVRWALGDRADPDHVLRLKHLLPGNKGGIRSLVVH